MPAMRYYLGIDVGSVGAKLALVDEGYSIVRLDGERITSSPTAAVASLISRLGRDVDLGAVEAAGCSGSGRGVIPADMGWAGYSSSLAVASGLLHLHPQAKTVIQIGGQSSLVITLEDGLKKPWKVASNPLCAAGTGRFLEQQAYRLDISMEDFSRLAQEYKGQAPRIAARCSVFAKTDLIHLQQKGVPLGAMLCGLCDSIARGVASLTRGPLEEPIYFVGGVAANGAIVQAMEEVLSARGGHRVQVTVPQDCRHVEALGAALLARGSGRRSTVAALPRLSAGQRYWELPPLERQDGREEWHRPDLSPPLEGYLGVDVGSTSTKAVVLDRSGGEVLAKCYLMTQGRPVDVVKEVCRNLLRDVGEGAHILGVGVTGSGRYLVGSFIGADVIRNEITAQTRAAAEIDPDADIIEIGGQDSKLVIKRNGVVVDYQMNKACAAGTGSFIDELAEQLGVSVKNGDFARLAFDAPHTIDLGSRCAAFMGQAVAAARQEGVSIEVIAASLANSIASNYLSKVVGMRRLGERVILTGAVFYNDAVVSAFTHALEGRETVVPRHKEVSGAIGAALLAREEMVGGGSRFKGFREIVESDYTLKTFTCKRCENNCTISRMQMPNEPATYYGSRCDRYDARFDQKKVETAFDERERLLFAGVREATGTGPTVGIPRALIVYDYAPLLIGFLSELGARPVLSGRTNKQVMEQAVELSYPDSCFPVKLLHGHVATLEEVDYIMHPCAIRLGRKEGDENQKYSCPLVQAAPFIVRQAFDLGKRLLVPIIDLSRGDDDTIESLADCAVEMGYRRREGRRAAIAAMRRQREFEASLEERGKALLEELHRGDRLGVVFLARSYMSQDSGANLGIAEKLAQLGVVPIPLDFLPLAQVDVGEYSDRPYWYYEGKHIAGAALVAQDPQLYGLVLTNFGCGPNSFVLNIVEDIMGGKPLGQLEIDEDAAEAGIVTRLEAFVDTIKGFASSGRSEHVRAWDQGAYRSAPTLVNAKKLLLIPRMAPHAEVLGAAMEAFGVRAMVMPESSEQSLLYSNKVTSGRECLPYRVTLGDFIRFFNENGADGIDRDEVEGFMASAFGPCRFGKYAVEQRRALAEMGYSLPMRTTVSNNAYRDLGLGPAFERLAWRGIVAVDYLERLLWGTRPYERVPGRADELFGGYMARVVGCVRRREDMGPVLKEAAREFCALKDPALPRRPLVGINGEIFLRANKFSNNDLVGECERAGLEVVVSSMGEWLRYIQHRNLEDGLQDHKVKKVVTSYIRNLILERDERSVAVHVAGSVDGEEPSIHEILSQCSRYLSPRCGSEAVLSIGVGVEWMERADFAGVISVMPHGCMPGGIVAAMSERLSAAYRKPWITLTYDGFMESTNPERVHNFAEVIRFCRDGASL